MEITESLKKEIETIDEELKEIAHLRTLIKDGSDFWDKKKFSLEMHRKILSRIVKRLLSK